MDAIDLDASSDKDLANTCSICLEIINIYLDRSTARLRCGHEFHLDCIGSAFNAKGVMQCPNCRKIEKGNWLFTTGSRSLQDLNFDEWNHDEDLPEVVYVHWCPFSRLARMLPLTEDGEISPAMPFHDLVGPYLAYIQPPLPPIPREVSGDHWNQINSITREGQALNNWEHYYPPYSLPNSRSSGSHQDDLSSTSVQSSRTHPFIGHGSGASAPPMLPFMSNPRPHGHAHHHHSLTNAVPAPPAILPDQTTYYLFPPTQSSNPSHQQNLEGSGDHFYPFGRDDMAPFPLMSMPMDRDSGYWRQYPRSSGSSYRPPHWR